MGNPAQQNNAVSADAKQSEFPRGKGSGGLCLGYFGRMLTEIFPIFEGLTPRMWKNYGPDVDAWAGP